MTDTLDLFGDGDEIDIVRDVERTFRIALTKAEAVRIRTVGELHDLIESKHAGAESTRACLSQTAFYRLRRALVAMGIDTKISPQTPILALAAIEPPSQVKRWRRLGRLAGLQLPRLETPFRRWLPARGTAARRVLSVLGWLSTATAIAICALAIQIVTGVSGVLIWVAAAIAVPAVKLGIAMLWLQSFQTVPRRLATLGDLAKEAAGCSFETLTMQKQGSSRSDRWFALAAILGLYSRHKKAITRDTTFFAVYAETES